MSYEKQTWAKGDIVTSAKLNHMEDGIATGGGVLVVHVTVDGNTGTLDHTWQEIHDAPIAVIKMPSGDTKVLAICTETNHAGDDDYQVGVTVMSYPDNVRLAFGATSADGYPSATLG